MEIKLSKNFTIAECQNSEYAKKHNIPNILPADCYKGAMMLANSVLEPIRKRYGSFSPNSWYRSPEVNKGVGGSPNSDHMTGRAADIRINGIPLKDLAQWIIDNLESDQLILEPNWVHISFKENNRYQVLHKTKNGYGLGLE